MKPLQLDSIKFRKLTGSTLQATETQGSAICQYQPCLILIPEAHLEPDFHPAAGTSSHTLINSIPNQFEQ